MNLAIKLALDAEFSHRQARFAREGKHAVKAARHADVCTPIGIQING
jgi:hypothetical protein